MVHEGFGDPGRHRRIEPPGAEPPAPDRAKVETPASSWFIPFAAQDNTQLMEPVADDSKDVAASAQTAVMQPARSTPTEQLASLLDALRKWEPGKRAEATEQDRAEAAAYMRTVKATGDSQRLAATLSRRFGVEFTCEHDPRPNALVLKWTGGPGITDVQEFAQRVAEDFPNIAIGGLVYVPRVGDARGGDRAHAPEHAVDSTTALPRAS
jgi:hypothetical protein